MSAPHNLRATLATEAPSDERGEFWLVTLDHRRLARAYAVAIGLALVVGVFLSLGLGMQIVAGRGQGLGVQSYRELYSVHGVWMVFLVALPAIPAVLGNWLLPEMVGLERMALPRLNLLAFQLFVCGFAVLTLAAVAAPLDAGWSFAMPFASLERSSVAWSVIGVIVVALSYVCASANVIATVVAARVQQRARFGMPTFAWTLAVGAVILAVASSVLVVVLALLLAERFGASDVFTASGAADVRFADWFWFFGHPALCAMLIGAIGLAAEMLPRAEESRRPASAASIGAIVSVGVFAFATWGVHLLGRHAMISDGVAASALALISGVPFVVLAVDSWARWTARAFELDGAASFALCFFVLLAIGGLAGVFLAVLPTAAYLDNTSFATAQFHYLVVGGTLVAALGGLHRFWPRFFGVEPNAARARLSAFLVFVGVNATFVPLFVLGYLGQPARDGHAVAGGDVYAACSAAGSVVLAVAILVAGWNLVAALFVDGAPRAGERVP